MGLSYFWDTLVLSIVPFPLAIRHVWGVIRHGVMGYLTSGWVVLGFPLFSFFQSSDRRLQRPCLSPVYELGHW